MARYRQNPQVAWREIDQEGVLLEPSEGRLLVLNGTGLFLWQQLGAPAAPEALAGALTETFDVPEEQARADVEAFLADLKTRKLIECL